MNITNNLSYKLRVIYNDLYIFVLYELFYFELVFEKKKKKSYKIYFSDGLHVVAVRPRGDQINQCFHVENYLFKCEKLKRFLFSSSFVSFIYCIICISSVVYARYLFFFFKIFYFVTKLVYSDYYNYY